MSKPPKKTGISGGDFNFGKYNRYLCPECKHAIWNGGEMPTTIDFKCRYGFDFKNCRRYSQ